MMTKEQHQQKPVAIVTGSTAGIGLAAAQALAQDGFHVVVSSRGAANVASAVQAITALHGAGSASGIACHVGRKEDRMRLLEFAASNGTVAALVLNAAVSTAYGPVLDTTERQWDKMFEVNVRAGFFLVKEAVGYLGRGAAVVFMGSIAGYAAIAGLGAYSVSKTAVLGLVKVLGSELAERGIRVNGVAPGLIKTKFSERLWEGEKEKFHDIAMKRVGVPDEIGGVVAFLVSDRASYITGETIVVGGGVMSKL